MSRREKWRAAVILPRPAVWWTFPTYFPPKNKVWVYCGHYVPYISPFFFEKSIFFFVRKLFLFWFCFQLLILPVILNAILRRQLEPDSFWVAAVTFGEKIELSETVRVFFLPAGIIFVWRTSRHWRSFFAFNSIWCDLH